MATSERIPLPMPWGWFQVMFSKDLTIGESKPIHFFDTDLVIFRTESGEARVLDAYCPHMGAHLGYGIHEHAGAGAAVQGESIVCPFHGWKYNGDGICTDVPYAKNLPPKVAKGDCVIQPWEVRELNQCIFVWYHPNGEAPSFEPEAVPEAGPDNAEWGELQIFHWEIDTHTQEMGENSVDAAHFQYVHGTTDVPTPEISEFDGVNRHGLMRTRQATPKGEITGGIENWNRGPGQAIVRFTGICETVLMANVTPISADKTLASYAFIQKKDNDGFMGKVAEALVANICQQMEEDKIIWQRKRYFEKPMLCDGDGPFNQFRKWYGQFLAA